ncbi:DUF4340 domain-containing protein [Paraglaciecola sp. 2405UD69-4]|uniref:DUF4340 domain-containing protein n=1 Tax=Paraglaciecola sp. 2405UD69-4 TaxID=3391836 RepID=UPI0039C929C7
MNKSFFILCTLVTLALGVGFWLHQEPVDEPTNSELVFENFRDTLDTLKSIEITNSQGGLLNAESVDGVWLASIQAGLPKYPVSKKHLSELLQAITQVRYLEAKTRKPQKFSELGLQALYAEDSIATLITFSTGKASQSILVGKTAQSGQGSFIRKPSETQSWLVDRNISVPVDKYSWLQQPILPFQPEKIVSVSRLDQAPWTITRDVQSSSLTLDNMPLGSKLKYEAVLSSVTTALTDLKFERLLMKDYELTRSLEILTVLELHLTDGMFFTLNLGKKGDDNIVYFSNFDGVPYWGAWAYQVSNFTAQQLIKSLSDFLEDKSSNQSEVDTSVEQYSIDEGESPQ